MRLIIAILFLFMSLGLTNSMVIKSGPAVYFNKYARLMAEIFPAKSRLNNDRPVCYFYRINYLLSSEEYNPVKRFDLLWTGELVDKYGPEKAIISLDGYLVTLANNDLHSLAIYDSTGVLIGDFKLSDIADTTDFDFYKFSPYDWMDKGKYYFGNPDSKHSWDNSDLYIIFNFGRVIDINLRTNHHSYGLLESNSYIDSLNGERYIDELAPYNRTWLDYSSVTEIFQCMGIVK